MDAILQGIPQVLCYIDDILVTGKTEADHLKNLEAVLKHLQDHGVHLKKEKSSFLQDSLEYLGHCINAHWVHVSQKKVEAILKAPKSQDVRELGSFLGLLNYYAKFIPNLSLHVVLHPLNDLLRAKQR